MVRPPSAVPLLPVPAQMTTPSRLYRLAVLQQAAVPRLLPQALMCLVVAVLQPLMVPGRPGEEGPAPLLLLLLLPQLPLARTTRTAAWQLPTAVVRASPTAPRLLALLA